MVQSDGDSTSVRVAVRVRPLNSSERQMRVPPKMPSQPLQFNEEKPEIVVLPEKKRFTFDHVFPPGTSQLDVFEACVPTLLGKFVHGYNATILAYGQTSSGKTYTMGTGDACGDADSDSMGIIPRAVKTLFDSLAQQGPSSRHQVRVSFLEVYNEELIDLLAPDEGMRSPITIREDARGNIYWTGVREVGVRSPVEVMQQLAKGSWRRQVGQTDMNEKSSRSHAIFSISLRQERPASGGSGSSGSSKRHSSGPGLLGRASGIRNALHQRNSSAPLNGGSRIAGTPVRRNASTPNGNNEDGDDDDDGSGTMTNDEEWVTVSSKFHFVDLAGSERLKRTNAVGDRAKEGISINAGLSALGNVISALGDASRKVVHIPYRDSKLTRLLQDSLGGNSQTLMIACSSPAAVNALESLNTLQYANRARNIKNKVSLNEEMSTDISYLQAQVTKLRAELRALKSSSPTSDAGRETSRAASPAPPGSPIITSIPSPLSGNRSRSRASSFGPSNGISEGGFMPPVATRRIQELEAEVTRLNASYQHLLGQYETICQNNNALQRANAANGARRKHRARNESVSSVSYAGSELSVEATDMDDEDDEDDEDEDDEELDDDEEEEDEDTGVTESEYGEETESEAPMSRRGSRQPSLSVSTNGHAPSVASLTGAPDDSFVGMTSFQQQVEPVIEEYEKVVAGLEADLRQASETLLQAEEELMMCRERARLAEQVQHAGDYELMELRLQLAKLQDAHLEVREQAADAECAQSEAYRLQALVQSLEAQLEEERETSRAALAAASARVVYSDMHNSAAEDNDGYEDDEDEAVNSSRHSTPVPAKEDKEATAHCQRRTSSSISYCSDSNCPPSSLSPGEATAYLAMDGDTTITPGSTDGMQRATSAVANHVDLSGLRDTKDAPTAAAVIVRLRGDLRHVEQRAHRLIYLNAILFVLLAYVTVWAYWTRNAGHLLSHLV